MSPKLRSDIQIWRLATDLKLSPGDDAVRAILDFCNKRIRSFIKEFHCSTLAELLTAAAGKLDTLFVEIHTDDDLIRVRQHYLAEGELAFERLATELSPAVYAITFRRTRPNIHDRQFVSVIDCRGAKAARCYFSKWHEIAHLLTLTSQARLKFCRTHAEPETKDPEEALMDVIAGEMGFFPELIRPHVKGQISFETIAELRERLCPEASQVSSLLGLVKAWPEPCVLVHAALGLRKDQRRKLLQGAFDFHDGPQEVLRAIHVTANGPAERADLRIPENMRIPEQSVISRVISDGVSYLEAEENLDWWKSSSGRDLSTRPVLVKARRKWQSAEALILLS